MSTIKRITTRTYSYELQDFGPGAIYQKGGTIRQSKFLVEIETDDGLTGAYAPHFGASPQALAQVMDMARGLIGWDAEQREAIFEHLKLSHRHYDKSGIAILDTALWDLAGKKYGIPVSKLLGGYRERLPVYASTASGQKAPGGLDSVEKYAEFAIQWIDNGASIIGGCCEIGPKHIGYLRQILESKGHRTTILPV